MRKKRKIEPVVKRFMRYVEKTDSCWNWTGCKTWGYGKFGINYKLNIAHRVSYELFVGKIPKGMLVCHKCDNRGCVNPEHLFLGTHVDNTKDMFDKGRAKGRTTKRIDSSIILKVRELWTTGNYKQCKLGKMFSISLSHINAIVHNKVRNNLEELCQQSKKEN